MYIILDENNQFRGYTENAEFDFSLWDSTHTYRLEPIEEEALQAILAQAANSEVVIQEDGSVTPVVDFGNLKNQKLQSLKRYDADKRWIEIDGGEAGVIRLPATMATVVELKAALTHYENYPDVDYYLTSEDIKIKVLSKSNFKTDLNNVISAIQQADLARHEALAAINQAPAVDELESIVFDDLYSQVGLPYPVKMYEALNI
jgi:hypothetical protein